MRTLKSHFFVVSVLLAMLAVAVISSRRAGAQGPPPGQGGAPVNIVSPLPIPVTLSPRNMASSPLWVRDVDNLVRSPFQGFDGGLFQLGEENVVGIGVEVPVGKLAVIDHISAIANVPIGQAVRGIAVCEDRGQTVHHHFGFQFQGNDFESGMATYVASQPLHCFASGVNSLAIAVWRNSFAASSTASADIGYSGYLSNLP